jgi:plasmid maintenance system antidote protein VapI
MEVQKRTVDTWIKGERRPSREQEIKLSKFLGVSLDHLNG